MVVETMSCEDPYKCKQKQRSENGPLQWIIVWITQCAVCHKSTATSDTIIAHILEVLAITELWHRASTDCSLNQCAPPGFAIVDTPCSTGRGGGVALLFDKRLVAKRSTFAFQPSTFEVVGCLLRSTSSSVICSTCWHLQTWKLCAVGTVLR